MSRVYDLEDRLIEFAVAILTLTDDLPKKGGAMILANQLMRSGTSPALNMERLKLPSQQRISYIKSKSA